MKPRIKQIVFVLLALFFFTACSNVNKEKDIIKIGAILPLTGKWAIIGENEQLGLKIALDSLQKKYPAKKIELIIEDFNSEIKNAVSAANKLSFVDKVDAIITSTTAAAEAVTPIINQNEIIHFVITPDLQIVDRSKYNFRIYYNFKTEGQKINEFLTWGKAKSVCFLGMKYTAIQREINSIIIPHMKKEYIQIVDTIYFDTKASDFKNQIIRAKSKSSDVIYLIPHVDQVQNLNKQLNEYDLLPDDMRKMIYSYTFNWNTNLDLSQCENFYVCTPIFQISGTDHNGLQKNLEEKNVKANFDMMYAFDNLTILVDLLIKSEGAYNSFVYEFNSLGDYKGASGNIKFIGDRDTDVIIVITQVKNGKFVKIL